MQEPASVMYIGSAPDCPKNRAYLPRQREAFLAGRSAPDFASMDFEVDFTGRAPESDLTPLGRVQMGFQSGVHLRRVAQTFEVCPRALRQATSGARHQHT